MTPERILVFHTAFIGDIVLALPLVQRLRAALPNAHIAFVAIPSAATVLENHPAINEVIVYDKRGVDAGLSGIFRLAARLRSIHFDTAIIPHRSLRSAAVVWLSKIRRRVGFSTSAGRLLLTEVVPYDKNAHEIDRNLSLAVPLGIEDTDADRPTLFPGEDDKHVVNEFLSSQSSPRQRVGIAPGSVWNTKRWLKEHFVALGKMLVKDGASVVLIGGKEDSDLCNQIAHEIGQNNALNVAGKLSLLQSAEVIRQCAVLVSNDSAPMHLAVGVRTPVVAIFGATVPEFGFAPRGEHDVVVGMDGLSCRPCAIHGGTACPIQTFVCMKDLKPEIVHAKVRLLLELSRLPVQ
jgi:lipopolysaccharide heptosyltransferase II